jgi:hypothetical protein
MSERTYTLSELQRPRWRQIVDRFVDGPGERFAMATLGVVGLVLATSQLQARGENEALREHALKAQAEAASTLSEPQRSMATRGDAIAVGLAKQAWGGDFISPSLSAPGAGRKLLDGEGVYFRAVASEIPDMEAARIEARVSLKDAVGMCLLRDDSPSAGRVAAEATAAGAGKGCAEGSGCMGETEGRLHNLRQLHRGLDLLGAGFAADVAQSGGPLLRAFDQDLTDRLKTEIPAAREIAQKAGYLLVVLDEAPAQGLPDVQWGTRRKLVETSAHAVRVGLFDARTGEALARLRRDVDATSPLFPTGNNEVRRQIQSCTLGLEVRRVILDGKI